MFADTIQTAVREMGEHIVEAVMSLGVGMEEGDTDSGTGYRAGDD